MAEKHVLNAEDKSPSLKIGAWLDDVRTNPKRDVQEKYNSYVKDISHVHVKNIESRSSITSRVIIRMYLSMKLK